VNDNIKDILDTLLKQHQALLDEIDETNDADIASALVIELHEVLHRITISQQLLLNETNTKLEAAAGKVEDASKELTKSLGQIQKAADVVKGVSTFLTYVDKAIDLAKALGVAAAKI
jgi:hypothetical protein